MSASHPAGAHHMPEPNALAEAERAGRPFLLFTDADDRQQLFVLPDDAPSLSVGRRTTSDLVLDWDDLVSRLHARLERAHDGWLVVDDGLSSNGTFVNEERVSGKRPLKDGDLLRFGATQAIFRSPQAEHVERPASRERGPAVQLSSTQRRVLAALCRPCSSPASAAHAATDQQIADELVLSVGEVNAHLTVLCAKLGIERDAPGDPRVRLVEQAFSMGLITERHR